jgi:hypothetical protein
LNTVAVRKSARPDVSNTARAFKIGGQTGATVGVRQRGMGGKPENTTHPADQPAPRFGIRLGPQPMGTLDEVRHGARVVAQAAEVIEMIKRLHGQASNFSRVSIEMTLATSPGAIAATSARTVLTARPGSPLWQR